MKEFYAGKEVLVTGGCGFIGSHVVEKLITYGAQVTILDNLSTGKKENIAHVVDQVNLIVGDITDYEICIQATQNKDIIFHLAAFISVPGSVVDPHACHEININGTEHLLEAARINNVSRFCFSSSSAIYGNMDGTSKEDQFPTPSSPYGMSKRVGELLCEQYAQHFGIQTVCLRYFNVYGPRQDPHNPYAAVVAKFTQQLENNLPITIFGDGNQTRDFISVQEVVYANLQCAMLEADLMQGTIFNIATGKSITVLELAHMLIEQYPDYTGEITFDSARPGDAKHSRADCTKYFSLVLGKPIPTRNSAISVQQ